MNLFRVRLSGVIAKDRFAVCPAGSPVSGLRSVTTVAGAASAGAANGTSPSTAATTNKDNPRNLRFFKVIHPLVVAVDIREVRRTPDQNEHHPPYGLWRQQQEG